MMGTVAIGKQNFEDIISHHNLYVDKTHFIKEWWENDDSVTLIARPRRFGKTLMMSTVEQFFAVDYYEKSWMFEGLHIFQEEKYRKLQGTYPVIFLSFAAVKETEYADFYERLQQVIAEVYKKNDYLIKTDILSEHEKEIFMNVCKMSASKVVISNSLRALSEYLMRCYGKKTIILLDEYDTPMQEAYLQ